MINEIKKVVRNYLDTIKLCQIMIGTCVGGGIKVSDRLVIPDVLIKGNLKSYTWTGDKVRLIRNHGGQEFYIVEIIDKQFILSGTVTSSGVSVDGKNIPNEQLLGNLKTRVSQGDEVRLLRDYGNNKFYMLEVIM